MPLKLVSLDLGPAVLEEVRLDDCAVQDLLAEWNDELIATIPGFTPRGGSTVQASEFDRPDGIFLLASSTDGAIGCGGIRRIGATVGEVKRLYARPTARGRGIGRALLQHLEQHAHDLGCTKVRLDTAGGQDGALALFRSAGYEPIPDYNGNPYARYWFEKELAFRDHEKSASAEGGSAGRGDRATVCAVDEDAGPERPDEVRYDRPGVPDEVADGV